jgi:hypothetical protein
MSNIVNKRRTRLLSVISNRILIGFALLLFVSAQGQSGATTGPISPAPSPQVKQTVDAITGQWSGKMTAKVPGFPAEAFAWTMDCKAVAMGAGASCANTGKASIGSMAESCLLAYDPEGKSIHYMCVTSMGEVHDHKGQWKDDKTIEFEPLRAGMMGQAVTETIRWHFPSANTIDKTSIVTLADGSMMQFEFIGQRSRK